MAPHILYTFNFYFNYFGTFNYFGRGAFWVVFRLSSLCFCEENKENIRMKNCIVKINVFLCMAISLINLMITEEGSKMAVVNVYF